MYSRNLVYPRSVNYDEFPRHLVICCVSSIPRWRMARCLYTEREDKLVGGRGGVVYALQRFCDVSKDIVSDRCFISNSLILSSGKSGAINLGVYSIGNFILDPFLLTVWNWWFCTVQMSILINTINTIETIGYASYPNDI